ncbi:hypothetical protein FRC01_004918 [Tulasnella sp. 417]|nr:hypothetical protein FRC01_004918 [Tulasnella sp. 417]
MLAILAQLLERATSERATPLANPEISVSDPASDAGASEIDVSEVPAPNVLVDYESSGSHNAAAEDAAFENSEMGAAAILDRSFVLDTEENEPSSSEGAPSSDDATSPAQANDRPASPVPPVAAPGVLVVATPALSSDDIEIPDSQANTTNTKRAPANRKRFDDGPSASRDSWKRPVASLLPPPHKRARLDEQVLSPTRDEGAPAQSPLGRITKSLPIDPPSVHSPPPRQVLAAATPSPLNISNHESGFSWRPWRLSRCPAMYLELANYPQSHRTKPSKGVLVARNRSSFPVWITSASTQYLIRWEWYKSFNSRIRAGDP